MANYFDQFEEIKEDNKQKSYWEQFEPIEAKAEVDEFDMDFQDPNKVTLGDRFNAVKDNLSKAIATTGQSMMMNRPYVPNKQGVLEGNVSKKSFLNDQRYWLKSKANNAGDSFLRIMSNMQTSNPYGNFPQSKTPVKTTTNEAGQKIIDYSKESPIELKVAGSRNDYETLKDIRRNPEKYSKVYNKGDFDAVKQSYLKGEMDYNAANNLINEYNTANKNANEKNRILFEDINRKVKNIEMGEAVLNAGFWSTFVYHLLSGGLTAIPSVGGKIVTGKLKDSVKKEAYKNLLAQGFTKESATLFIEKASKAGVIDAGVKSGIENYGKNLFAQYGINNAIGETVGKAATNATLAGTMGAIDMGLLSGGINQYTNYLGVTDNNPFESAIEGAGHGALFSAALSGATPLISNVAGAIGNIPLSKSYKPLKNSIKPYTRPNETYNYQYGFSNGYNTGFKMGEGSDLRYPNRTEQDVQYNQTEKFKQIAPKTVAKQQAKALEKAEKTESNYEQVMEEARNHTIKTGEQTRVTKNDNGMYEYKVVKPEVANVDAKIAELERKMKLVGGEKTQLGQKYKRQIEELRGTEQAVAPVSEEVKPVAEKPVENIPSKTEEAPKAVETEEVVAPKTETVEPTEEIVVAETTETTKPVEKPAKKNSIKYSVKIDKNGNKNGFYGYSKTYHTDGNAMYKFDDVDADVKRVDVNGAVTVSEKIMKELWSKAEQNANKLEDLGKYFVDKGKRKVRLFQMGNYENGEPKYVYIDSKYLLNQKGLEVFAESPISSMSVRKDGKQIGVVMPITMKSIDNVELIDVPKMIEEAKAIDTRSDRKKAQDLTDYVYAVKTKSLDQIEKIKKEKGAIEAQDEAEGKLEFIEKKYKDYAKYMENNEKELTEEVIKKLKGYIIAKDTKPVEKPKKTPKNTEKSTKTIEDSGEFLMGNRKEDKNGLSWEDLEGMNDLVRAKNLTKAKIYPKPSIDSLQEQGLDTFQSAIVQHIYNKIANKIPAGYETRLETQKEYTENIKNVMDSVIKYFKENPNKYSVAMTEGLRKDIFNVIYPDKDNIVGRYDSVFRKYPEYNRHAGIMGGNRFVAGIQIGTKELQEIRKIIEDYKEVKTTTSKVKKEDWEKTFIILEPDRWNNKYQVALAKSKRSFGNIVSGEFETREEAVEFARKLSEMQAQAKSALKKANFERDYIQRRDKDVSADELRDTFGFKGVNFGNYVTQKERQDFLNYTYDSLHDLAELLNLPPKALSLNGQLGVAFGAQGRGGKAAGHYIPDYHEINMTKDSGAGTLAHEWWHAFDNYFGSKAEGKEFTNRYGLELSKQGEIREEVYKAFAEIDKQMRTAPFTEEEIQKRKEAIIARCESNIKYYADEVKKTFRNVDGVAEYVDEVVANKDKYMNMSDEDLHNIEWKDFGKLIPEKRKTIQNMAKFSWLTSEIKRMGRAEEIATKTPPKSQYLKDAERLNEIGGMGNDYWTKHTEMGARAFTTYLLDKMETQQIVNKFLTRSQEGEVSFDFKELAKELKDGEKRNFKVYWNPTNAEEKARIFSAFDNLFDTIKTRETEKGVELYSFGFNSSSKNLKDLHKVIRNGARYNDLVKYDKAFELLSDRFKGFEDYVIKADNKLNAQGMHSTTSKVIYMNTKNIETTQDFIEVLAHELKHAKQHKKYLIAKAIPKELRTEKQQLDIDLYEACDKVNSDLMKITKREPKIVNEFVDLITKGYNEKDVDNYLLKKYSKKQAFYKRFKEAYNNYINDKFETDARNDEKTIHKEINYARKQGQLNESRIGQETRAKVDRSKYVSTSRLGFKQVKSGLQSFGTSNQRRSIEQTVRDKVYDWHGGIGKDRYDVDKTLNSFIRMSKNIAKDISQKTGLKVSDKQLREMLPFLRERTNIPEKLDRDDLKKIFNALSGEEKARLVKFADDTSNKFEKYYKNYLDAKGEVDEATIENHISHIWDLDDKKQALLTNYITTKSKFAKQRTIETLAKGINGIEIDGKIVEFKPKTLDYAEILKSSSDNLIKATYDMQLAETIKGMKDADGNPLVLPVHKAPADWIEVSHPALNKAVYMGTVGEDELPMLMKSSVKVHPDLEKYVASIFETPKTSSKFWKGYDSINGILKQTQLGFSGFHGYALSESALANMGVKKTLDSLNVKKVYDAVKNGNYEIYEHEAEAKRAIEAGVQLGTPSDLNRNLVEETLNKIPVLGKYISGAVSVNNKILWDVLHNNFKLFTFNAKIAELEKAGKVTKEQERAVAQWVNDTYGGQSWELLGVKNSDVRKAGRVLLSPDWNFSTVRQALGSINNTKLDKVFNDTKAWKRVAELMGVSENIGGEGVRGKIARDFWIRAVVYSTIFYNAMNAAFRADDRKKHPERYPKNMKPFDYSIWANANPMDNWYEKLMPYVFIGRNSDGTARMLRVGKQFREVPELAADPITKLSGKSASIIGLLTQVAVGMSPADIVKKVSGREAYLNQNIWEGYGEDARMRDGIEAVTGRLKVAAKGAAPFMLSKYIDGKHEPSAWDMFAQTSVGSTKGKVYKEAKEAFEAGREDKIREIKQKAYRDGVRKEDINKMVGYAEKNYKADNTKKYRKKFVEAMKNKDKKELNRIKSDMQRHHLSAKEQRRIYESAYKKYLQER